MNPNNETIEQKIERYKVILRNPMSDIKTVNQIHEDTSQWNQATVKSDMEFYRLLLGI
jgi:hypothetical protein